MWQVSEVKRHLSAQGSKARLRTHHSGHLPLDLCLSIGHLEQVREEPTVHRNCCNFCTLDGDAKPESKAEKPTDRKAKAWTVGTMVCSSTMPFERLSS